jgi:hypothetical protein
MSLSGKAATVSLLPDQVTLAERAGAAVREVERVVKDLDLTELRT